MLRAGNRLAFACCLCSAGSLTPLPAQGPAVQGAARISLTGQVFTRDGEPAEGATVRVQAPDHASTQSTVTDQAGWFVFSRLVAGTYTLSAEKAAEHSAAQAITLRLAGSEGIHLTLNQAGTIASGATADPGSLHKMDFSDQPDFTVAGVTDWTAVGGHGSDATLRTSEDLARETLALKAQGSRASNGAQIEKADAAASEARLLNAFSAAPNSDAANRDLGEHYLQVNEFAKALAPLRRASQLNSKSDANAYDLALAYQGSGDPARAREQITRALQLKDAASYHRLASVLDEALGDSVAAVRQDEMATHLDPSEADYLAWGSELLLHRAIWQASEVLAAGAKAHPSSARLKTAWGAALFASALYDEAAQRLCEASDLDPGSPEPYVFMGKVALVAPKPLACIQPRLERRLQQQPNSAETHYVLAMALLHGSSAPDRARATTLLRKAVVLDPKCAAAYLQLGIFAFGDRDYREAVQLYQQAIAADPHLSEAHYRLGMAYDRTGETMKAQQELQLHTSLDQMQADAIEQQRQQVKQFLIVLKGSPEPVPNH